MGWKLLAVTQWFSNFFKISNWRSPKIFFYHSRSFISTQNQVKSEKKIITSADFQFSTQNHVKSKKGHLVRRFPIFPRKTKRRAKKRSSRPQMSNQAQFRGTIYQKSTTSSRCPGPALKEGLAPPIDMLGPYN